MTIKKEQWDIMLEAFKIGMTIADACDLAMFNRDSFYNHMKEDPGLAAKVTQALADCKKRNMGIIQKEALKGTWQSAAWYLERKHPAEYALRSKVEHTIPGVTPVGDLDSVSDQELQDRIQGILGRLKPVTGVGGRGGKVKVKPGKAQVKPGKVKK